MTESQGSSGKTEPQGSVSVKPLRASKRTSKSTSLTSSSVSHLAEFLTLERSTNQRRDCLRKLSESYCLDSPQREKRILMVFRVLSTVKVILGVNPLIFYPVSLE
jgi:hypothetical protein